MTSNEQVRPASVVPRAERAGTLPDVLQFMQLLWAVVHGIETTSKGMKARTGVTGPQRLVLRVVGLFPGLSAGELASIMRVHPSTLTGILQRLVAQGLIARAGHPHDRRRAVLRLTIGGARANASDAGTIEAAVSEALTGVSAHDRAATRRVLQRLAGHLKPPHPRRHPTGRPRSRAVAGTAGGPEA